MPAVRFGFFCELPVPAPHGSRESARGRRPERARPRRRGPPTTLVRMSERELNEDGTYTVQAGDTLWAIAESFYGAGSSWSAIYESNKETIGDNSDLIQPGQELLITPIPADDAETEPAPADEGEPAE